MNLIFLLAYFCILLVSNGFSQKTSSLWGERGERWKPDGSDTKLLDFTDVGYMKRDILPPEWPVSVNVKDFGAIGDGETDDTEAFLKAVAAAKPKSAVLIPKGRYKLLKPIRIERENIVLRGEDMYETVLWCPKYLAEILPYSVKNQKQDVSKISYNAMGQSYEGWIISELGPPHYKDGTPAVDVKVARRWPLTGHPDLKAYITAMNTSQVGVENLSIELREQKKGYHWEHVGANGIHFEQVENCWIKNVYLKNMDHGITVRGSNYVSVLHVLLDAYTLRAGECGDSDGHAGVRVGDSDRILLHDIRMTGRYIHCLMLNGGTNHNVYSRMSGSNLKLEHHSVGGRSSLFTEIDFGLGTRTGIVEQRNQTYWGLTSREPISYLGRFADGERAAQKNRGPVQNVVVGLKTDEPSNHGENFWHEVIDPAELTPKNLYLAQMTLKGKPLPEFPFPVRTYHPRAPRDFMPTDDVTVVSGASENDWESYKLEFRNDNQVYVKFDLRDSGIAYADKAVLRMFDGDVIKYGAPFEGRGLHPEHRRWEKKKRKKKGKPVQISVHGVQNDAWQEASITRANAPEPGQSIGGVQLGSGTWHEIDITSYLNEQLEGDRVISLVLQKAAEGKKGKGGIMSSNGADPIHLTVFPGGKVKEENN